MEFKAWFQCINGCSGRHPLNEVIYRCPKCDELLEVQHDMGDAQAWLDKYKGQTLDGLVERVLSGDRMLVRVILSPTKHVQSKISVST